MSGVSRYPIEVDDAIEAFVGACEGIDCLTHLLAGGVVVGCAAEGVERGGEDFDSACVCSGDDLLVAPDQLLGRDGFIWAHGEVGAADVVGADRDDEIFRAGLRQDVAVEA